MIGKLKFSEERKKNMAKAVLVMDMPESCSKCKFLYEFQGIKKCQLMNVLNNGASMLSQNTFIKKRHDKCPLRELPEREKEMTDADALGKDYVRGTMDGFAVFAIRKQHLN